MTLIDFFAIAILLTVTSFVIMVLVVTLFGDRLRYKYGGDRFTYKDGKTYEASEGNMCEGCAFHNEDGCDDIHCPAGVIYKEVKE